MANISSDAVLQSLLGLFSEPAYLEVGVAFGATFHSVRAVHKVAVDPYFAFKQRQVAPPGCSVAYHEMTSDAYFGTIARAGEYFDVIYLDGLHTFEQTLRDLINALDCLAPDGIIVVDDVRPNNYPAALPDMPSVMAARMMLGLERDSSWMGDVYKLVFFIDTFIQQFSFATVQDNLGQLVMWRQQRPQVPQRSIEDLARLQFMHCATEREVFRLMPFAEILALVKAAR